MSFKNANSPKAAFIGVYGNTERNYPVITAVTNASRQNNFLSVEDGDFGRDGKFRKFKVTYYPLNCDPVGSCSTTVCDAGVVEEPKQEFYAPKGCIASKVQRLNVDDLRWVDDGGLTFSDHAKAQINAAMPGMRKELATQMAAKLATNAGLLPDGTASRRVTFANGTNGMVNPQGQWEIERAFADAGYNAPYVVGGAADIYTWQRATAIGAANNGINTAALGLNNLFYDPLVNDAFGTTGPHIIAFDPAVLKFVSWSENAGIFATDWQSVEDLDKLFWQSKLGSIHGTFLDPVTRLLWDFDAKFVDCAGPNNKGYFQWQLRLNWDILFMPQDCGPFGTNGIFHFTACAPVLAPCPTGDAYPTPPTPETYEYTPGAIFPYYIGELNIAGQVTEPGVNVANITELAAIMNANSNMTFTVSGSDITYSGLSAISGSMNGGTAAGGKDITFTEAA